MYPFFEIKLFVKQMLENKKKEINELIWNNNNKQLDPKLQQTLQKWNQWNV